MSDLCYLRKPQLCQTSTVMRVTNTFRKFLIPILVTIVLQWKKHKRNVQSPKIFCVFIK